MLYFFGLLLKVIFWPVWLFMRILIWPIGRPRRRVDVYHHHRGWW